MPNKLPPKSGSFIINKDIRINWEWNGPCSDTDWKARVRYWINYKRSNLFYGDRLAARKNASAVAYRAAVKQLQALFSNQYDINALSRE